MICIECGQELMPDEHHPIQSCLVHLRKRCIALGDAISEYVNSEQTPDDLMRLVNLESGDT